MLDIDIIVLNIFSAFMYYSWRVIAATFEVENGYLQQLIHILVRLQQVNRTLID
jgi:hypothetical protein